MSKALWIAAFDERVAELEDEGLSWDEAYARASDEGELITGRAVDRIADMADAARDRAKYGEA